MSTSFSQRARTALSVTGWTLAAAIVLTALASVSSAPSTDWSSTDWRRSADWSRTVPAGLESAELKDTSTQRPDSDSLRLDRNILPGSRLFGSSLPGDSLSSDSLSRGSLSSDSFSGNGVPSSDRPENADSVENAGSMGNAGGAKTNDGREGEPPADQTAVADAAADAAANVAADTAAGTGVVKSSGETSGGAVSRGETPQGETPQGEMSQGEMSQEEAQGSPTGRGSSGTGLAEAGSPELARSPQSGQAERWETERWETKQGKTKQGKTKQGNVNQGTGASPRSSTTELRGLVVDETITPQGRTFYTEFYGVWQSPPVDGFYTVEVREKPTPGRAALVRVFVNDDMTFQARLQPQTDIAERALQAARRTYGYVRSGQGILQIY